MAGVALAADQNLSESWRHTVSTGPGLELDLKLDLTVNPRSSPTALFLTEPRGPDNLTRHGLPKTGVRKHTLKSLPSMDSNQVLSTKVSLPGWRTTLLQGVLTIILQSRSPGDAKAATPSEGFCDGKNRMEDY